MDGAKKSRNPHKAPADYRSDRKSASGMSGEPKKGGRGGKFTWEGADGYADEDLDLISPKNSTHRKSSSGGAAADSSNKKQNLRPPNERSRDTPDKKKNKKKKKEERTLAIRLSSALRRPRSTPAVHSRRAATAVWPSLPPLSTPALCHRRSARRVVATAVCALPRINSVRRHRRLRLPQTTEPALNSARSPSLARPGSPPTRLLPPLRRQIARSILTDSPSPALRCAISQIQLESASFAP